METLRFDLGKSEGKFKILNATNGGPWAKRHANDQYRTNMDTYKAARIPYTRNHDSSLYEVYGGPYSHDISCIFPNFDADEFDPSSYDFGCTDEAILCALEGGSETFFRLGQAIENQIKKHNTIPPRDFLKWARICEHIILHYNHGWAEGFELNIKYWEIWNEPNLDTDDSKDKRCWGGTKAQFFDFYEVVTKYLKGKFPELKIGGPAVSVSFLDIYGDMDWVEDFIQDMAKRQAPLDFFSWHIYCAEPEVMLRKARAIRGLLDKYGYKGIEIILNEWNYIKGWCEEYVYSIKAITGIKGATFTISCMSEAQYGDIDMLMYYATTPCILNGAFDLYTCEPLKGYYALYWYGLFYDLEKSHKSINNIEHIYSLCGTDKDGKVLAIVTHYTDDDEALPKYIEIDFEKEGKYEIYLLDKDNNGTLYKTTENLKFTLSNFSSILIKEI